MSLKGMSDAGPTTAAADAPLANDKETLTTPSAGTTSFRRFRGEACFVFGILEVLQAHVAGLQSRLRAGAWQRRSRWPEAWIIEKSCEG